MAFKREKALAAAKKYAAKGQHDKAAREYQAVVDDDPKDLRAWLMLAGALHKAGKVEDALARYLQVGKAYSEKKEYSKALAVYRQALVIDARRIDVHLRCAQLHVDLRQIPDAVGIYEKVGKVYLKQGRSRDALELFKTVAELDPKTVTRRLRLAELYSREKMNAEAVAAFRVAGQTLLEEEKHEEYVRVAERLLYHKDDDRETILGVVRAYIKLRQPRRALVKLNGLLQSDPSDVEGLELLCETFVRLGKVDKAVSVVLEIVREHATGEEGEALARRVLERGLEWAPNNPDLQAARAQLDGGGAAEPEPVDETPSEVVELDDEELDEFDEFEELEEFEEFEEVEEVEEVEALELDDEDEFADASLDGGGLADQVMSEASRPREPDADGDLDLDLQLQEARVLSKYRLHDNALAHLDVILEADAHHIGALELRVEILERADRAEALADALVQLARVLLGRDPTRAARHAREALDRHPGHADAQALLDELGPDTVISRAPAAPAAPAPAEDSEIIVVDDDDDDDDFVAMPDGDSSDFAISVDDGDDDDDEDDEPLTIEDRFGLPEESAELPIGGIADISEEVEAVESLLAMGQEEEAERQFLELATAHPNHPALSSLSERFSASEEQEEASDGAAAQPLLDLEEDDEAEDYLAGIFADEEEAPAEVDKEVEHRGRAQVAGGEADASTHYDLGTAYHGMGLRDDAVRELELAAADPGWTCRACILMATVHQQLAGDVEAARGAIERAVGAAKSPDEVSESNYLLGEVLVELEDFDAAREAFERVAPGFRDRDAKLAIL